MTITIVDKDGVEYHGNQLVFDSTVHVSDEGRGVILLKKASGSGSASGSGAPTGSSSASASGSGSGSGVDGCPDSDYCTNSCADPYYVYESCFETTHTLSLTGAACTWNDYVADQEYVQVSCVDYGAYGHFWDMYLEGWDGAKYIDMCLWYKPALTTSCPGGNYTLDPYHDNNVCCDANVTVYS